MITINATLKGENTYDITVGENAVYRVSAFDLESAIDRVADYIEAHGQNGIYFDSLALEVLAKCSAEYPCVEMFAKAYKLTKCGTNGIYLEITSVKGVKI